jgi:diacylglycerol kinase family enzyme
VVTTSFAPATPAVAGPLAPARGPLSRRAEVLLLINPRSSRHSEAALTAAAQALRDVYRVTPARTEAPGHATRLAAEAARHGFDAVIVAGGDGTVSEAAAGLVGTPTVLACLPAGCTNVFARSIGTPRRLREAAERLAAGVGSAEPRAIDVGLVDGHPFLCTSGVGLSASMTAAADTDPQRKARLGQVHFAASAAAQLGTRYLRRPPRMRVEVDGRVADGVTAVIQNSHALTYFGPREIRPCPHAGLDTGALSLTLLERVRPRDVAPVLARLVAGEGRVATHPHISAFPAIRAATITTLDGEPLPVEADGEYLGERARIDYAVAPGALRVL